MHSPIEADILIGLLTEEGYIVSPAKNEKLVIDLVDAGFVPVWGTREFALYNSTYGPAIDAQPERAWKWDYNNGVTAVWDEKGRPWCFPHHHRGDDLAVDALIVRHDLERGVHVPHSNSMGYMWANMYPKDEEVTQVA